MTEEVNVDQKSSATLKMTRLMFNLFVLQSDQFLLISYWRRRNFENKMHAVCSANQGSEKRFTFTVARHFSHVCDVSVYNRRTLHSNISETFYFISELILTFRPTTLQANTHERFSGHPSLWSMVLVCLNLFDSMLVILVADFLMSAIFVVYSGWGLQVLKPENHHISQWWKN